MNKAFKTVLSMGFIITALLFGNMPGDATNSITTVYAAQTSQSEKITVLVDNKPVELDQEPVIVDGHVMIPLRVVAETMGWEFRINSPTVFQLANAVKYTDGYRTYLFTCHTSTINLDLKRISRRILVGVGNYIDPPNGNIMGFSIEPIIVNGNLLISVNDLPKCLYVCVEYDELTKTVRITNNEIPYYDGQGLSNRDELLGAVRRKYNITGTLTKVGEPHPEASLTCEPSSPIITTLFQPTGVMTSAPEVGSFPANILLPGKKDVNLAENYYEPYKTSGKRGCNWYAFSRFYETYGYRNPVYYTGGAIYLDTVEKSSNTAVKAERDLNKIISGCIAVYANSKGEGHVVFVDFVERDATGKPINVYYTECMNTDKSGTYRPASDGKVVKVSFERFKKSTSGTKLLQGYVVPQQ